MQSSVLSLIISAFFGLAGAAVNMYIPVVAKVQLTDDLLIVDESNYEDNKIKKLEPVRGLIGFLLGWGTGSIIGTGISLALSEDPDSDKNSDSDSDSDSDGNSDSDSDENSNLDSDSDSDDE